MLPYQFLNCCRDMKKKPFSQTVSRAGFLYLDSFRCEFKFQTWRRTISSQSTMQSAVRVPKNLRRLKIRENNNFSLLCVYFFVSKQFYHQMLLLLMETDFYEGLTAWSQRNTLPPHPELVLLFSISFKDMVCIYCIQSIPVCGVLYRPATSARGQLQLGGNWHPGNDLEQSLHSLVWNLIALTTREHLLSSSVIVILLLWLFLYSVK